MIHYICVECGEPCDIHEREDGGYEEFWGAKVWHQQFTSVSDCCNSEDYDEVGE